MIESFITSITQAADGKCWLYTFRVCTNEYIPDGRLLLSSCADVESFSITYQCLNPSPQFQALVDSAQSIILAGGTLSPVRDKCLDSYIYILTVIFRLRI